MLLTLCIDPIALRQRTSLRHYKTLRQCHYAYKQEPSPEVRSNATLGTCTPTNQAPVSH